MTKQFFTNDSFFAASDTYMYLIFKLSSMWRPLNSYCTENNATWPYYLDWNITETASYFCIYLYILLNSVNTDLFWYQGVIGFLVERKKSL